MIMVASQTTYYWILNRNILFIAKHAPGRILDLHKKKWRDGRWKTSIRNLDTDKHKICASHENFFCIIHRFFLYPLWNQIFNEMWDNALDRLCVLFIEIGKDALSKTRYAVNIQDTETKSLCPFHTNWKLFTFTFFQQSPKSFFLFFFTWPLYLRQRAILFTVLFFQSEVMYINKNWQSNISKDKAIQKLECIIFFQKMNRCFVSSYKM